MNAAGSIAVMAEALMPRAASRAAIAWSTRDGAMIALAPCLEIDATQLATGTDAAMRAARDGDHRRAGILARSALERAGGELLPDEPYADWAIGPRRRTRARQLELLDLLVGVAEGQGEVDEAVRLARRAIELDPEDDGRYVALAALLRSQGRESAAVTVLRDSRADAV